MKKISQLQRRYHNCKDFVESVLKKFKHLLPLERGSLITTITVCFLTQYQNFSGGFENDNISCEKYKIKNLFPYYSLSLKLGQSSKGNQKIF